MTGAAGKQLGPYVLESRIGEGGMGEVWKARDTRLNRTVAIKQLKREHNARFQQEARTIAALNHPNICTLYDIGPDYLVMEYVEGAPLKGPLPADQAVRLAIEIADALAEAHAKGVLHRDLKPGNILLTTRGSAKLLDFGLAKLTGDSSADITQSIEGTVVGTAPYMSPEQAQGRVVDERSDIFSFGAVLYEMLAGRRAFQGHSPVEIMSAVLRDEPAALDAPAELVAVIVRCLKKDREERFASMAEVRAALGGAELRAPLQTASLPHTAAAPAPSIAVLPFANMSRDADDEYFSDGLAEEILNALVKIPGLKVIARTSSFAFKGQNTDIRKIAEALGVAHILEGSVRRAGNRVRVTAQLITAADGSHLWSERYDRQMEDIFAVQDEVSAAIAAALEIQLSVSTAGAKRRYTPKLPAYEAFLKARFCMSQGTPQGLEQAVASYREAIRLDPGYALAYTALGHCISAGAMAGVAPAWTVFPQTRELARRALEIDPDLPEAQALLGLMAAALDYDWEEAGRRFQLALSHPPVSPDVRRFYAFPYLTSVGRVEEAVSVMEQVVVEDPLYPPARLQLAITLLTAGRSAEAIACMQQAQSFGPPPWAMCAFLGLVHAVEGRMETSAEWAGRGHALAPWNTFAAGVWAGVLAQTGQDQQAREVLAKLGAEDRFGVPYGMLCYHVLRGDLGAAAASYERAIEQRDPRALHPGVFGRMLRDSEHWPKLARMMKLPEQAPQRG